MKNKKMLRLATIFLCCSLTLAGCSGIESVFSRFGQKTSGEMLFSDDFSNPPNGWGMMEKDGGEIKFIYEGVMFSVDLPHFMYWSVNGKNYRDTGIEVDAVLAEGPANDNFGVICRFRDGQNFYAFLLSHDGYYSIIKKIEGNIIMLSDDGGMTFSDAIRQGGVANHVQASCRGDVLTLSVNDTLLAEVVDDSLRSGKVGLVAGAYDEPGVVVFFDNFRVYQP